MMDTRLVDAPSGAAEASTNPALEPPGWVMSLLLAAVTTALACYPVWPGYMSYDSLLAYRESVSGIETGLWPPMHPYLFALSRMFGAGPGGVLIAQIFVLFVGANISLHLLVRSRVGAALLSIAFAISFVAVPSQLGTLVTQWHDVPTTSFTILAVALWLLSCRRRSPWLLAAALVSLGVGISLRYNTLPLVVGVLALMIWRPFLAPCPLSTTRIFTIGGVVATLLLAWASTQWRLPDLARLPATSNAAGTQEFDLIGVSACTGRSYLPEAVTAGGWISPRQIRMAYDPRHLQRSLAAKPGVPPLVETDGGGAVGAIWRTLILHQTRCYLAHRLQVFIVQMGLAAGGPYYPVHGVIDSNPYGLALAHPGASNFLSGYIRTRASELWRRPFLLYIAAAAAAVIGIGMLPPRRWLIAALSVGICGFLAFLFVAAPAADSRYIFPTNTVCCLLILLVAGGLMDRHREIDKERPATL